MSIFLGIWSLKGEWVLGALGRFPAILQVDNCHFLYVFLHIILDSEKWPTLIEKSLLPLGANSFQLK